MTGVLNSLTENAVQCWSCPVFDRLFQVVSGAAAAVYDKFALFCAILFCVLFSFYVFNAVWQNIKGGMTDPFYQKTLKPVIINSIVMFAFLGMGVALPRFITTITFEPVANITLIYSQSLLRTDTEAVEEKVTYQPMPMRDDGFFRPQLRDTIFLIMKTTITQFQAYMKLGIAVMDHAFSWKALLGIGALIKHIIMFMIGLYLFYGFFKLFVRFCFYFADLIIAMTFFAFFFPLSMTLVVFKGAGAPKWMEGLGKNIGTERFKELIGAIVGLGSAVITYTIIMVIIAKFFSANGASADELTTLILQGNVFEADLSDDNLEMLTLGSSIVLVYVLNFIYDQIPQVTTMILNSFNVSSENKLGNELANNAMKLTGLAVNQAKRIGSIIVNGGKKDDKESGDDKKPKSEKKTGE